MRLVPFLFAFLLFSQGVSAADYYYTRAGDSTHFPSALAACERTVQIYSGRNPSVSYVSGYTYSCVYEYYASGAGVWAQTSSPVYRNGDACPSGQIFNASLGRCEDDPCLSKSGQTTSHEMRVGSVEPGSPRVEPPTSLCKEGCQVSFNFKPLDCYRFVSPDAAQQGKDLNGAYCAYEYKYNGMACTDADTTTPDIFDQPPTKPPTKAEPTLTNATQCDDWVINADGSRTRNCTANEVFNQSGTMNCSTSGPALSCVPGTPPPAYSDKNKTQQTTEKANADGSTSTTTTTTTDKTTCYGIKPCTSTSKTETDTGGTEADGSPADQTKECVGDGCTDSGEAEDPAKDPEEGEEDKSTVSGDGTCGAAPSCSGDAIQCAMLRQQHALRCHQEEQDDFPGNKDDIKSLLQGERFQVEEGSETDVSSLFNTGTRFLPAACPADSHFSLTTNGGRSFGISYLPLCQLATDMGYLIVIAASLFFAIYVGRGVGGE